MAYTIEKFFLTKNNCYKAGRKRNVTKGIVKHSTGCNNKYLARYIPDSKYGTVSSNHWNQSFTPGKCVHFMIGLGADNKVHIVQTLPLDVRCWGCGTGAKGSYNDTHIQYEILEDGLSDGTYYNEVMNAAEWLDAYLCKTYNLTASSVVSHKEAHAAGYASNHADCDNWLKVFGESMAKVRTRVNELLTVPATTTTTTAKVTTSATVTNAQTYVQAKEKDPSIAGTYKVVNVSSVLRVRRGPSTKQDILAKITNGTTVKNYGFYTDVDSVRWLLIKVTVDSKTVIGYASSKYLKKV